MTQPTEITERISTGIPALDEVLGGGVPRYATVFIAGAPGTGKTVLCQQALFANARRAVPALYLGTLAEPTLKMIRHAETFRFFQDEAIGKEIIYSDLGPSLAETGGAGLLEQIDALIKEHRPAFLVIDSFKVIRDYFVDSAEYRRFISQLLLKLATWEVTSFLVGEYSASEVQSEPEFAVADGILYLYGTEEVARQKRFMRVMKMRGTSYFAGQHLFEISADGIELYPRMDPYASGEYTLATDRLPSSITGLTEMLGGGIQAATAAMIVGSTGAGKSLTALSFVIANAEAGRPGLYVTFEERPEQLIRNAGRLGMDLGKLVERGLVELLHVSPSELDIDKHATVIQRRATAIKAELVVIDTLSAISASKEDHLHALNYFWAITDYFKRQGVAVIMTYEGEASIHSLSLSENHLSFLADALIVLRLTESDGRLRRTISVPKMRGTNHDDSIREWFIEESGLRVAGVYAESK